LEGGSKFYKKIKKCHTPLKLNGKNGLPVVFKQMSVICETAEGDMHTWVMNELYQELLKVPLWVQCTFGKKNEAGGSEFVFGKTQYHLATDMILKTMNRCPPYNYNTDFRHDWKMRMFVPLFRQAWVNISYKASF
jgi:hypothetical protein